MTKMKTIHLDINNTDGTHRDVVALTITPTPGEFTAKLGEAHLGTLQCRKCAWIGTDTAGIIGPGRPTMVAAISWLMDQSDTAVAIDRQVQTTREERPTNLENRLNGTVHTIPAHEHSGRVCRPGARTTCGVKISHDGMEWTEATATCRRCTRIR